MLFIQMVYEKTDIRCFLCKKDGKDNLKNHFFLK